MNNRIKTLIRHKSVVPLGFLKAFAVCISAYLMFNIILWWNDDYESDIKVEDYQVTKTNGRLPEMKEGIVAMSNKAASRFVTDFRKSNHIFPTKRI